MCRKIVTGLALAVVLCVSALAVVSVTHMATFSDSDASVEV
jgi:hypothetical protein